MWPALVAAAAVMMAWLLALWVGFWMGRQSSRSESQAAQTILDAARAVDASADRALDQANRQANLAMQVDLIRTQVQQQTESSASLASAVDRLDANVYLVLEALTSRGLAKKVTPRQAGETVTTNPPPPMPLERIPEAKSRPSTASSEPPTVTG